MEILASVMHPFILNLSYSFHDVNYAYMVTEYLKGGDLRFHLDKKIKSNSLFTEK